LRALQGRYGVDHSEILNFEFEQANKAHYDHLNLLVYKNLEPPQSADNHQSSNVGVSLNKTRSNALFERLTEKEIDEMRRSQSSQIFQADIYA
jgi:hypothetical protein